MKAGIEEPKIALFLKFWLAAFVFVSHGWLLFLFGMIWKSIPWWFEDKEKIQKQKWWISVREAYNKIMKTSPSYPIIVSSLFICSFVLPFSYGIYINWTYGHLTS